MNLGFFGMNVTGSLVMTRSPRWHPSFKSIIKNLNRAEAIFSRQGIKPLFLPISRWKGYGGALDIAADSIESVSLASSILTSTENIFVYASCATFAYAPEMIGHVSARLNYEFNNRFGLNLIGGWKKDEFDYFGRQFYGSSEEIYMEATTWLSRFRHSERSHARTLGDILPFKQPFVPCNLMCAAFSPEGRAFAAKNGASLFTTIRKIDQATPNQYDGSSCAFTLFVRETIEDAKAYYEELLGGSSGDSQSATNFCDQLADSNAAKSLLNRMNIHLVKSGAGIEELVTDPEGLADFLSRAHHSGINNLLFSLPDYDESLDILLDVVAGFRLSCVGDEHFDSSVLSQRGHTR